jgi:hypothetical protein
MSQTNTASDASMLSRLGTLVVIPWSGENQEDGRDTAFLMAYTLGNGVEGPAGSEAAVLAVARQAGLPVGGEILDFAWAQKAPVKVLVEGGKAILTMPYLHAVCPVPDEWTAAARSRGTVYVILASKPWPRAVPRSRISEADLQAFAADPVPIGSLIS